MKTKYYARKMLFVSTQLCKAMIPVLLLVTLQSGCLGQISSYTDVGVSDNSVVAYGAILDAYSMGTHINTTVITLYNPNWNSVQNSGGDSATTSMSTDVDGYYTASTSHDSWCPYTQATITPSGGSQNQTQACADECAACNQTRDQQTNSAYLQLGACELLAVGAYEAALQICNNQNYCKENHPDYNQSQCDDCKQTALTIFGIATGACGVQFANNMNNRINCNGLKKNANCQMVQCSNN